MSLIALIVDDEALMRSLYQHALKPIASRIYLAENLKDGLKLVHDLPTIDLVTLDLVMPGSSFEEVFASVKVIRARHPHCSVVILTGSMDADLSELASAAQADVLLQKQSFDNNAAFLGMVIKAMMTRAEGEPDLTAKIKAIALALFPDLAGI